MDNKLLHAADNAAATLGAIYKWVDMIDAEGGATTVAGVAKCHAMLASLRKNRKRFEDLVLKPVLAAIDEAKS